MSTTTLFVASAICYVACSGTINMSEPTTGKESPITKTTMQTTTPVSAAFFEPADEQGHVELMYYDSKDYTLASRPATRKPAYVYLPYGYDATKKYDIVYLLHGWTGTAEDYFGRPDMQQMKHLFDNLIAQGHTRPFIAVSPTWDKDNCAIGGFSLGAITNGYFFQAGLVDELSIVVCPHLDEQGARSIIKYQDKAALLQRQILEPIHTERLDAGCIWLHYRIHQQNINF